MDVQIDTLGMQAIQGLLDNPNANLSISQRNALNNRLNQLRNQRAANGIPSTNDQRGRQKLSDARSIIASTAELFQGAGPDNPESRLVKAEQALAKDKDAGDLTHEAMGENPNLIPEGATLLARIQALKALHNQSLRGALQRIQNDKDYTAREQNNAKPATG